MAKLTVTFLPNGDIIRHLEYQNQTFKRSEFGDEPSFDLQAITAFPNASHNIISHDSIQALSELGEAKMADITKCLEVLTRHEIEEIKNKTDTNTLVSYDNKGVGIIDTFRGGDSHLLNK